MCRCEQKWRRPIDQSLVSFALVCACYNIMVWLVRFCVVLDVVKFCCYHC